MSGTFATGVGLSATGTITLTSTSNSIGSTYTSSTSISEKEGFVLMDSSSSIALTLAAPTSGTDDGKLLTLLFVTPAPSGGPCTVTTRNTSYGDATGSAVSFTVLHFNQFNGNSYGTGRYATLFAYQGHWYLLANGVGVTAS